MGNRIDALERLAESVSRHTHQDAWIMIRANHNVEQEPCPLCVALVDVGVLREDEVGIQSRSQEKQLAEHE